MDFCLHLSVYLINMCVVHIPHVLVCVEVKSRCLRLGLCDFEGEVEGKRLRPVFSPIQHLMCRKKKNIPLEQRYL